MGTIVITGSTRGIGLGLAEAFLERGSSVVINGRTETAVNTAVNTLQGKFSRDQIIGFPCDVSNIEDIRALWDFSVQHFGKIEVWINNAGYSGPQGSIFQIDPEQAKAVIETNLMGVIYGSITAVEGMLEQGYGSIYNMEGMGSDGRKHNGLAYYGTTKYAVSYYTDCLANELKHTPLIVAALRPGMVITDMIRKQYEGRPDEWERAKKIFNIIANRVEDVTPWMAEQILANKKSGVRLSYTSGLKLAGRMLASPFHKRNIID